MSALYSVWPKCPGEQIQFIPQPHQDATYRLKWNKKHCNCDLTQQMEDLLNLLGFISSFHLVEMNARKVDQLGSWLDNSFTSHTQSGSDCLLPTEPALVASASCGAMCLISHVSPQCLLTLPQSFIESHLFTLFLLHFKKKKVVFSSYFRTLSELKGSGLIMQHCHWLRTLEVGAWQDGTTEI